jgi:hypothetical protein
VSIDWRRKCPCASDSCTVTAAQQPEELLELLQAFSVLFPLAVNCGHCLLHSSPNADACAPGTCHCGALFWVVFSRHSSQAGSTLPALVATTVRIRCTHRSQNGIVCASSRHAFLPRCACWSCGLPEETATQEVMWTHHMSVTLTLLRLLAGLESTFILKHGCR